jgi:glycosyltransferase involved in cell wall biosynthesis
VVTSPVRAPRVALVVDSDTWGGAEVYAGHLLRRAADQGWQPSLVCSAQVAKGLAGSVPEESLRVVPLLRHGDRDEPAAAALRALRPDAVLVNLVDPGSNAAVLAAACAVAPTVATLHLPGDLDGGPGRDALTRLYRRLAGVISPSTQGRDQVVCGLGVRADRVRVVPNGVDIPEEVRGPDTGQPPLVGVVARLTRQKGVDVLLRAVRRLRLEGVPLRVAVAGAGRDAAALAREAADLPVTFCGFLDDVPAFLRGLDVFCLPSRQEALPLALLEAMAVGLPCVVSDVGDVRAAVEGAAVLVRPEDDRALADVLRRLLSDEGGRARLRGLARARAVGSLDADLMARRTFTVLRELTLPRAPGGWPGAPSPG